MKCILSAVIGFLLAVVLLELSTNILKIKIPGLPVSTNTIISVVTNQGNIVQPSYTLYQLTNGVTNYVTMTNIIAIYDDDSNYNVSPFIFEQSNQNLEVRLYKRNSSYIIKQWESYQNLVSARYNPFGKVFGASYQRKLILNFWGGLEVDSSPSVSLIASYMW